MKVWCFGYNEHGQCGREIQTPLMTPKPIENLMGLNIAQVSCGRRHSLFPTDRNEVYACGSNEQGQLGIGVEFTQISTPVKIDVPPIKKIGCGENFSVLLDEDGNLHTFGAFEFGQLGYHRDINMYRPQMVSSFKAKSEDGHVKSVPNVEIKDFDCGSHHTVLLIYIEFAL